MKPITAVLALALGCALGGGAQAQLGALAAMGRLAAEAGAVAEASSVAAKAAKAAKLASAGAKTAEAAEAANLASTGAKAGLAAGLAVAGLESARAAHLDLRINAMHRFASLAEQGKTEEALRRVRFARDYITELAGDDPTAGKSKRRHAATANDALPPAEQDAVDLMVSIDLQRQFVLRPIAEVSRQHPRFRLVPAAVKNFGKGFKRGAANPGRYLDQLVGAHEKLKTAWLAAPVERRVFIIGSGKDASIANALKARYRARGIETFFYDFCAQSAGQLCSTDAVGAFFATAGQCVLLDSANVVTSQFIALEVALAKNLHGIGPSIVVVTPAEVLKTGHRSIEVAYFASRDERSN